MRNKKVLIIFILALLVILGVSSYYYFGKEDKKTSLTVNEKNWIERNKNRLIDLAIPSDVAVLSNDGDGFLFDFLNDLEENTNLDFNKLSYTYTEKPTSDYAVKATSSKTKNDMLIYQDNYVLISKNKIRYINTDEINHLTIGVMKSEMDNIDKYLYGSYEVVYKPYESVSAMTEDVGSGLIDLAAVPRLATLSSIIENPNLNIAYNITEYTEDYVLTLGSERTLNSILKKYYKKWASKNLESTFEKNVIDSYFTLNKVADQDQAKFRSKRYNYGFVVNSPFDTVTNSGLKGYNHSLLSEFATASNIEIDYKKYSNIEALTKDFEANNLDIIFNYSSKNKYNMDVFNTVSVYDEKVSVIAKQKTDLVVNSVNSLTDKTVLVIKSSKINDYLSARGVKTKAYNNIYELMNHIGKDDLAVIDYYTYDYYVRNDYNDIKNLYTFNLEDDYSFLSRVTSTNKTFNELFDYYLSFSNTKQIMNESYNDLLNYNSNSKLFKILIIVFSIVLLVLIGFITNKIIKRSKNKYPKLTKEDKLRYIDGMTSLKNRNYLNDNIDAWDSSKAYPQSVIIVDLNNIAYINDNFGHAEGDKVIVQAAGILITNQIPNSEIIRTSGNEFMIFTIGQDEKAIITYIRKLHKEFKNVSHGFGAAIGYSMINDDIKTIDDAVNEATIDMRNNKEEDKQA